MKALRRLDALNRIGNQVFFEAMLPVKDAKPNAPEPRLPAELAVNFAPVDAPVSFPPIWSVSWFRWAQYDASVHNELIRNAGEALGVKALINLTAKEEITVDPQKKQERFRSSVHLLNIFWIEDLLAAINPLEPAAGQDNPGIQRPARAAMAGCRQTISRPIRIGSRSRTARYGEGRQTALSQEHCVECHHGPVRDKAWEGDSILDRRSAEPARTWSSAGDRRYYSNTSNAGRRNGTDRSRRACSPSVRSICRPNSASIRSGI